MTATHDLHTHSTYSDGVFSPAGVVDRAARAGVTCLALSDHDETGGLPEARGRADERGMRFIAGVEISVTWRMITLHVIGLGIDPEHAGLRAGLAGIRAGRLARAQRIARALEGIGVSGSLEGARAQAGNPQLMSRTHFARYLVAKGYARDLQAAFRRFLGNGATGHVPHEWAGLGEATRWITDSGGIAVLAHPARYRLDHAQREEMLSEFRDFGGAALEVVSGNHTAEQISTWAGYATRFGLRASAGSDFHGPTAGREAMGNLPDLPGGCRPVWNDL